MLQIKKVAVGISGGVDSAVTALLLKQKGFNIQGVFMQNWDIADEQGQCTADKEFKDAQHVCDVLKIPLKHVNFVKPYWHSVFSELINDYVSGRTPNPDILCNRHIKFDQFYDYVREHLLCDAVATGHYASTSFGPYLENYRPNQDAKLFRATDEVKDQTFFLSQIPQKALRMTMFPLGSLLKSDVKRIASVSGLNRVATKKESMGICFIGTRKFQQFISEYVEKKPGRFVDIDTGKIVGYHNGIHQWTIGQRGRIHSASKPYYIARKNPQRNVIYVASGTDHPALYTRLIFTSRPHWIHSRPPEFDTGNILECQFKFQHSELLINCRICQTSKGLIVNLETPKRAITAGQYAVFYKNRECLGSAKIDSPGPTYMSLMWLHKRCKDLNESVRYDVEKPLVVKYFYDDEIKAEGCN